MADELLAAEDDEFDVITIQIDTMEDAWNFAENCHMLHKPVSFLSDSEEALEMALLMYN
jgi:5-methyltetrahydrofolate--homocysteine methyltransferase